MRRATVAVLTLCCLPSGLAPGAEVDYGNAVASALKANKLADVNRLCIQWAKAEPGDERPRIILGRVMLKAGMVERAIEQFELATEANPLSPAPRCEMGLLFLSGSKPDMAIKEFDQALRVAPACLAAMVGRARAKLLKGDSQEALEDAERALGADSKSPEARAILADCLLALGKTTEALVEFERVLGAAPANADALFGLAKACQIIGKDDDAQQYWSRFLEVEPSGARAERARNGWVVLKSQRLPKTCRYYPVWSPDGKRIMFGYGSPRIISLADESIVDIVAPDGAKLFNHAWSPDGKELLCRKALSNGKPGVFLHTLQPDGMAPLARPEPLGVASMGQFSPDGAKVLLSGGSIVRGGKYIPVGLALFDITAGQLGGVPWLNRKRSGRNQGAWGPDGETIVFHAYGRDRDDRAIFTMRIGDRATARQLTDNGAFNSIPAVSPDGRSVAYATRDEGPQMIHLTRASGGSDPVVVGRGSAPCWSPDGHRLAYDAGGGIVIAHLGGLDPSPVRISTKQEAGQLLVTLTNRAEDSVAVTLDYALFDADSFRVAQGHLGEPAMALKSGDQVECQLNLADSQAKGDCTVKLTAVTVDGKRAVKLVDVSIP